ncbi:hypothetical protein DSO57_1027540 [Entomophthora muscae]|uniref:Uncharacterized protein n=1 Tax=Entomophthora muscae TaxID=34485 RepID=A0ACC2RSR6_9FUNG|nr:hypothetical protein DSO57_1027540 [Entomophthora muscae]
MTDRGREFIGTEFTRLLQHWYCHTEGLAPAEVQVYGGDACFVIGKIMEEFALLQAKYKLLTNHSPLLENDNSSKPVPCYDPGHTLGTGDQEPHTCFMRSAIFSSTGLDSRFKIDRRLKMAAMVNSSSRRVPRRALKKVQVVIPKRSKNTRPVEVMKSKENQVVLHDVDGRYLDLGVHLDQLLVPRLALVVTDPLFVVLFLALSGPREVTGTGLQKGNSIHWWFFMWVAEEYLKAQLKEF